MRAFGCEAERNISLLALETPRNGASVKLMIDAGMTHVSAKNLPLSEKGVKLVFSRRMD